MSAKGACALYTEQCILHRHMTYRSSGMTHRSSGMTHRSSGKHANPYFRSLSQPISRPASCSATVEALALNASVRARLLAYNFTHVHHIIADKLLFVSFFFWGGHVNNKQTNVTATGTVYTRHRHINMHSHKQRDGDLYRNLVSIFRPSPPPPPSLLPPSSSLLASSMTIERCKVHTFVN